MERDERAIAALQQASARLVMIIVLLLIFFLLGKHANRTDYNDIYDNNLCDKIDPRNADEYSLARLPGIGPNKAKQIVDYRQQRPISSVSDLDTISGFGPKTMEKIHNYLYFKELP